MIDEGVAGVSRSYTDVQALSSAKAEQLSSGSKIDSWIGCWRST